MQHVYLQVDMTGLGGAGRFFSFTDTVCCCCWCWCQTYSPFHFAITATVTFVTLVTCCHVMRGHCSEMDIDSGYLVCR